jgi:hypothetical protein
MDAPKTYKTTRQQVRTSQLKTNNTRRERPSGMSMVFNGNCIYVTQYRLYFYQDSADDLDAKQTCNNKQRVKTSENK